MRDLLGTPLGQFGLGAIALVIGGALLFTLIGAVSDTDTAAGPVVDPGEASTATDEPGEAEATDGETGGATAGATDEPGEGNSGATDEPSAPATDATDPPTGAAIDPATVTVQVLDGAGDDGSLHAAAVECLQQAGFESLITENDSSRVYETTTVFYTSTDDQAAGQSVAAAIGASNVQQTPDEVDLSDEVPVHVVVGQSGSSC